MASEPSTAVAAGSRFANVANAIGMSALGVAALAKAYGAEEFHDSLAGWSIIPTFLHAYLATALPTLEWAVFVVFLLSPARRRQAARAGALLVGAFTAGLLVESAVAEVPICNCFGTLLAHEQLVDGLPFMLLRNAVLFACLLPAWCSGSRP
jgi:hypothetical protein